MLDHLDVTAALQWSQFSSLSTAFVYMNVKWYIFDRLEKNVIFREIKKNVLITTRLLDIFFHGVAKPYFSLWPGNGLLWNI